jgi:UDP-glucose 4-epimerase
VFAAAAKAGVKQLINASSACVYGQARFTPQNEVHPQEPNWAYGVSKLAAEQYGRLYHASHGLSVTSLRYAIIYGQREWYGRALTIFLKRALEQRSPVVFGDGSQERDFTYVGDLVRLHNACISNDAAAGEVFNVSTGVATTIRRLAELVVEVTGFHGDIVHENVVVGGRSALVDGNRQRLPSELQQMVLSSEKAQRLLGWTPQVELRKGLQMEFDWLRANAHRWSRMSY